MPGFETIISQGGHEQVVFCYDKKAGLKAIIAIHNTNLGPALGGTRMWNYKSEEDALIDVLRLSKGMTYKAAAAGLNLGGGKAVIIGDARKDKSEALFRSFGLYINSLNGKYITAEDVGTSVQDMEHVFMETPWVTGIPKAFGGSGDPSPYTANGTYMGIKAAVKKRLGTDSLSGIRVAVQGIGNVGKNLIELLHQEKAILSIADIDKSAVNFYADKCQAKILDPEQITTSECDVFAPCAMGAVINENTINKLKCTVIAGGANNVLAQDSMAKTLKEMNILYAPDYVINAGGLMNVFVELEGYSHERALAKTNRVYDNLMTIFDTAETENLTTLEAANRVAEKRIELIGAIRQKHPGMSNRNFSTLREVFNR